MKSRSVLLLMSVVVVVTTALGADMTGTRSPGITFKTLYTFTGGADGSDPFYGLTMDNRGNLYGFVDGGGLYNNGGIYKLVNNNGSFRFQLLHSFDSSQGQPSYSGLTLHEGTIYGTTQYGGPNGCGILFSMAIDGGKLTTLHAFCSESGDTDGAYPVGKLVMDSAGNLYGTTDLGGTFGEGTVFEYSNGMLTTLVDFNDTDGNGYYPGSGLNIDQQGNLWGTNTTGGSGGNGTVFELTPNANGGWNFSTVSVFSGTNGDFPGHGIVAFRGNVFGSTIYGGKGLGLVYALETKHQYQEKILYRFNGKSEGGHPDGKLQITNAGQILGTTQDGGSASCSGGCGVVFELTPTDHGWAASALHSFDGSDGCLPSTGVILDKNGNAFGTTSSGCNGDGTVFEISGLK